MAEEIEVFESPSLSDRRRMLSCVRASRRCYVVEPFHAYHHTSVKGVPFFPSRLPDFAKELIGSGKVSLLRAEQLGARELYLAAAERAVATTDRIFPLYRDEHRRLCTFLASALGTEQADDVFRRLLCERLGVFFSMNMLFSNIEQALPGATIRVFVRQDPAEYLRLKALATAARVDPGEHPRVVLSPRSALRTAATLMAKKSWRLSSLLSLLALACRPARSAKGGKSYLLGFTIVSPLRQFRNDERGAGFLVDDDRIRSQDVVYLPLTPLTPEQQRMLRDLGSDVYDRLAERNTHAPLRVWLRLLVVFLRTLGAANEREVFAASASVAEYYRWKHLLGHVAIRHLVTHADFGFARVARNIALQGAGVRTWYFTDAANFGLNFASGEVGKARHPLWTYLNYDALVTWYPALAEWLLGHPSSFRQAHVVGCLWAQHVRQHHRSASRRAGLTEKNLQGKFLVVAYGSTYSVKCVTAYDEGVAFVKDLLRLAAECPDVFIILKDKKPSSMHVLLEPELGQMLFTLQSEVAARPNMELVAQDSDASRLMADTDLIVSFPFTSTTLEALAADRPAIWHDPLGYYRDTPYGRSGGAVTHSYDELRSLVERLRVAGPDGFRNPFPPGSPLIDPFRDGKAIDRFRQLLTSSD